MDSLDFSEKAPENKKTSTILSRKHSDLKKNIDSLNLDDNRSTRNGVSTGGKLFGFFKGLVGQTIITSESLKPVLTKMRDHLIAKNTAFEIAEKLCHAVSDQLVGKTCGTFESLSRIVYSTFEATLTNILTPKKNLDILENISINKSDRPYVIVFCGVNGVGKSTNLAKIAFYLLNNDKTVLIAACDTFRSGAVEQLRTHVCRFTNMFPSEPPKCSLFEKGYGKDAASVASEAIKLAVLIDTSGRMQNNEPLMRSLAKVNNPDLVLFVGEALVGNDGVHQLMEFNRHLAEFSDSDNPHCIDGIVLTKFDAIDDKVGAALSMTYSTSQPILFVGVGQTYNDLRVLDVSSVVSTLLT